MLPPSGNSVPTLTFSTHNICPSAQLTSNKYTTAHSIFIQCCHLQPSLLLIPSSKVTREHTGSLLCKRREKQNIGSIWAAEKPQPEPHTGFFFSCFLPSGHTVVIDRLTRAEWFLFPPEEQNTACVLSYAEGKTREKKIRDRKKTASTSTGCLSLKLSPKHCCRNKRKFHTLGIIPKKLQICYESYELNNEVEAHNSYFFYSNIS